MSDLINKQAAIDAIGIEYGIDASETLEGVTEVDAVEVVRCKDCVYYVDGFPYAYCDRNAVQMMRGKTDYCSRGERRPDADE